MNIAHATMSGTMKAPKASSIVMATGGQPSMESVDYGIAATTNVVARGDFAGVPSRAAVHLRARHGRLSAMR
ncbi:hypothetical protein [Paraburkholderia sp. 31.1]|uniref:hypothetical protein n=1 Tax=Paraburkholderia sp. 31.1 TaxID=2615205 RepID=UPI00165595FC|nr:hypothetical protein [Paraburkholderia sp. 31.1]